MCGIIGTNAGTELAALGLSTMQRGRDGSRLVDFGDVTFGFQRHQIVGGESGMQPFANERQMMIFNGELFDHEKHASELGITNSQELSDSEVLFALLCRYGPRCLYDLDIMAAGAFGCRDRGLVTLFRDWAGEMPLHYAILGDGKWVFSSTQRAIFEALGTTSATIHEVQPAALVHLPIIAGNDIRIDEPPRQIMSPIAVDLDNAALKVRHALERSSEQRFWGRSKFAVMVSGGIDSTLTLHLTLKQYHHAEPVPIYTFHCADEPITPFSDLYHARRVANHYGDRVDHKIVFATKDELLSAVNETVEALEDSRAKDFNIVTALYNRFIAEAMARDGIKVAYLGEGADEALASYDPWGSYTVSSDDSGLVEFRKKMVANLHKGVLLRTSKVMMNFGPIECRSYFLNKDLNDLLTRLPAAVVRCDGHRKGILIKAFSDEIPAELLSRPKARPQDACGISRVIKDHFGHLDIGKGLDEVRIGRPFK